jgi:hypothetical protein
MLHCVIQPLSRLAACNSGLSMTPNGDAQFAREGQGPLLCDGVGSSPGCG